VFGQRFRLFKLLGFEVQVDASLLLLGLLVTWTLAAGYFPSQARGLATATYWTMGLAGALGLFVSIVLHELSHSVVARWRGLAISGITLFIFGGVAHMEDEPASAGTELLMAIAGPLASIGLTVGFYLLYLAGRADVWPLPILLVLRYLSLINGLLAAFNLIPAFPLDGGRVFRAALWRWKHNLRWATQIAARTGSGFAIAFMGLGALDVLQGNLIGGIWLVLIGMFLRGAAGASYRQVVNRQMLQGETVRDLLATNPVSVPGDLSIRELVEGYVYHYHIDLFPVTDGRRLIGCISTKELKGLGVGEWDNRTVAELMVPCSAANSVEADTGAMKALEVMRRTGHDRLVVRDGDRLLGVLSQKDMLRFLSLKLDLESVN
jgi:Zn-dependent protease/predicted transcriptional regulator